MSVHLFTQIVFDHMLVFVNLVVYMSIWIGVNVYWKSQESNTGPHALGTRHLSYQDEWNHPMPLASRPILDTVQFSLISITRRPHRQQCLLELARLSVHVPAGSPCNYSFIEQTRY